MGPGLVWALDIDTRGSQPVSACDAPCEAPLRWLHLDLVAQGTQRWIAAKDSLPASVRDLLLSPNTHQRALVEGEVVAVVIHDFERDFGIEETDRVGALRIALAPGLVLTCRQHALASFDLVHAKAMQGGEGFGPPAALDLIVSAISDRIGGVTRALAAEILQAEEAFLEGHTVPDPRELIAIRRRLAQLHRLLSGMRGVFLRLEHAEGLPAPLLPTVRKLSQQLQSIDGDILAAQSELRLLREDLDGQATQRTNQNLYMLSVITALMLPATLVTGLFGMNTGGLPLAEGPWGTFHAALLALAGSGVTYALLRWSGFMRR